MRVVTRLVARPVALARLSSLTPYKHYVPKYAIKRLWSHRGAHVQISRQASDLFQIWIETKTMLTTWW